MVEMTKKDKTQDAKQSLGLEDRPIKFSELQSSHFP